MSESTKTEAGEREERDTQNPRWILLTRLLWRKPPLLSTREVA